MKNISYEINILRSEFLYLIAFFFISLLKTLGLGASDLSYKISMIIAIFICLLKFLMDLKVGFLKKDILILFCAFLVLILNYIIINDVTLILSFIFFVSVRNVSLIKIFKVILFSRILGFIINIIMILLGFREIKSIEFYRDEFIIRGALGLGHPNFLHYIFFTIVILYVTIYKNKINILKIAVLLLINYYVYNITFSRTGFYNVIIFLVLFLLLNNKIFLNLFNFISCYIQLILFVITYILSIYLYKYDYILYIDKILTGRLTYSAIQINHGLSIFGNNFDNSNILFDNSYSMLYSQYGIIIFISVLILYINSVKKLVDNNLKILVLFMLIFSITLFTESYYPSITINLSLIVIAKIFFGEINEIKREFI